MNDAKLRVALENLGYTIVHYASGMCEIACEEDTFTYHAGNTTPEEALVAAARLAFRSRGAWALLERAVEQVVLPTVEPLVVDPSTVLPMKEPETELELPPDGLCIEAEKAETPPDSGAPPDWIGFALDNGETPVEELANYFHAQNLTSIILENSEVLAVTTRRGRRRLGKVRALLQNRGATFPSLARPAPEQAVPRAGEPSDEDAPTDNPLIHAVRAVVQGTQAVLVLNKDDEHARARVQELMGFASLDLVRGEDKRVDILADRIVAHRYDYVLCADGFLQHEAVKKLVCAAKKAGDTVHFVRVSRGRIGACLREVARHLGLSHEGTSL